MRLAGSGSPEYIIGVAIGAGMPVEAVATPEVTAAIQRFKEADEADDIAHDAMTKARRDTVPDAPFKNEGWLSLSIKSALVGAVEHEAAHRQVVDVAL